MQTTQGHNDLAALVLLVTKEGAAPMVAQTVSKIPYRWDDEVEGGYTVRGVRWAAVIKGAPNVMLGLKVVDETALDSLMGRIKKIEGVLDPDPMVVEQYYVDGKPRAVGHNGLP